jgi:hypothetical protein
MLAMARENKIAAEPEGTEIQDVRIGEGDLTLPETMRLFEPVSEMMGRANWDQLPRIFAVGLVVHRLLEKNAELIRDEAQAILDRSRKKI